MEMLPVWILKFFEGDARITVVGLLVLSQLVNIWSIYLGHQNHARWPKISAILSVLIIAAIGAGVFAGGKSVLKSADESDHRDKILLSLDADVKVARQAVQEVKKSADELKVMLQESTRVLLSEFSKTKQNVDILDREAKSLASQLSLIESRVQGASQGINQIIPCLQSPTLGQSNAGFNNSDPCGPAALQPVR